MLFGRNRSTISSTIRDTPCELSCTLRKGRCELNSNFAQIRPSTIFLPSTWLPLSSLPLTTLQIAIAMSPASADEYQSRRKRILIVGAGASGMACADQLSLKPDQYEVTIIEVSLLFASRFFCGAKANSFDRSQSAGYCGGQAFSISVDASRFGTNWLNQGVQGGSHVYHHVYHYMSKQRLKAEPFVSSLLSSRLNAST